MTETITILQVEDVYPHPDHYREVRERDVETLAASIARVGQIEPITVFADGDIYYVDAGHHRLAALKKLGTPTVAAVVLDEHDDAKSASIMVASNMHFPETEIERSRGTQLMLATGVRPADAAAIIGERDADKIERAARGAKIAADYAEDMSIDRLAALVEFEGDEAACKAIMTAYEEKWRGVYADLKRAQRLAASIVECKAVIKAAGVREIADRTDVSEGFTYLGRGIDPIEGAAEARVEHSEWSTSAEICWYGTPVADDTQIDPAEAARREQADRIAASLDSAAYERVGVWVEHLRGNVPSATNAVRDFAVAAWEAGVQADVDDLSDTEADAGAITGFLTRVYASVLASVDRDTAATFDQLSRDGYSTGYLVTTHGPRILAYFTALEEIGYQPCEAELGLLAEIEQMLHEALAKAGDAS